MTNGDRIRQMTDEELARLFYTLRFGGYGTGNEIINAMEESRLLKWLKDEERQKEKQNGRANQSI